MPDQNLDLWAALLIKFGYDNQKNHAIEECAELIQAINKHRRNPNLATLANVYEEIADVEIMLDQLKFIYSGQAECDEIKKAKVEMLWKNLNVS